MRNQKSNELNDTARERLISAAVKLFALQGYDKTTTREIASEAGSSISMLNLHFGGKEQLYEEVISHVINVCIVNNIQLFGEIIDSREKEPKNRKLIWKMISELISLMLKLISNPDYQYEMLLLNREIQDRKQDFSKLESFLMFFYNFELLFESYADAPYDSLWAKELSYFTVTGLFSAIGYPSFRKFVMPNEAVIPTPDRVEFLKEYHLSVIRATLNRYKKSPASMS